MCGSLCSCLCCDLNKLLLTRASSLHCTEHSDSSQSEPTRRQHQRPGFEPKIKQPVSEETQTIKKDGKYPDAFQKFQKILKSFHFLKSLESFSTFFATLPTHEKNTSFWIMITIYLFLIGDNFFFHGDFKKYFKYCNNIYLKISDVLMFNRNY